jgi:two-component system chemotaxis response regulator CheY
MTLAKELMHRIADPVLTQNQRAQLRCQLAKQLEDIGDYEGARAAMGELWSRINERPILEELDHSTMAEVLLRAGALTGWIGSAKQVVGAQETAKNLITESLTLFQRLETTKKIVEAQIEIALCYWREGAFDEARAILQDARNRVVGIDRELEAVALLRSAIVEKTAIRLNEALQFYAHAVPLFNDITNDALKGRFHNGYANLLENLGRKENRKDYIDRAFIEYAAASYHFEQAGNTRYHACVENNLGFLFLTVGKFTEAHEHLDRAQALFTSIKDSVHTAQVDETRARVLLAEGRVPEAEKLVRSAVQTLDKGGEQALLAEALTTHGIALARLGRHQHARLSLQRAVEVAQQVGDLESAGQAAIIIIEEMGEQLSDDDLVATYNRAVELLSKSRDVTALSRLSVCGRRVLFLVDVLAAPPNWTGFSFRKAVRRYEARLIEKALRDAGGLVTRAAQLLGFNHHNSLISMLNKRHRNLLPERTPPMPRRRSLMTIPDAPRRLQSTPTEQTRIISVLHVENNLTAANAVKETLQAEGWKVEMCADGAAALKLLESAIYYDVLLLDNDLPDINGVELIRRARQLPHRRRTRVVMLAATNSETGAWKAGADAVLKKPQDVGTIVNTISRLLSPEAE